MMEAFEGSWGLDFLLLFMWGVGGVLKPACMVFLTPRRKGRKALELASTVAIDVYALRQLLHSVRRSGL
jgi:hypothetical protein